MAKIFLINAVPLNFQFKESRKKVSLFKMLCIYYALQLFLEHHIRMISNRSCDTEDTKGVMMHKI